MKLRLLGLVPGFVLLIGGALSSSSFAAFVADTNGWHTMEQACMEPDPACAFQYELQKSGSYGDS